jgi:UDP-3-O-[3-hydroxymyristoyl] N-acetylglucosamine deacetylase
VNPEVVLEGRGLHGGRASRLTIRAVSGPLVLAREGVQYTLSELVPSGARRSTELFAGETCVLATTEHLFAAAAAHGLHEGLLVTIEGDECPLLDGGARVFANALASLGIPRSEPSLVVARAGELSYGSSVYRFVPRDDRAVRVSVLVDFDDPRLERHAAWEGEPADFDARIAAARTFGFEHELGLLIERGLASHVAKESVVLIASAGILSSGEPFFPDEPARHKLLDLLGDAFVWGGPPRGEVHAERPGHAATHDVFRRALAEGILAKAP